MAGEGAGSVSTCGLRETCCECVSPAGHGSRSHRCACGREWSYGDDRLEVQFPEARPTLSPSRAVAEWSSPPLR